MSATLAPRAPVPSVIRTRAMIASAKVTPTSPIRRILRIALSHVGRFLPHDAKAMDGRWAGASDELRCRRGIPGNPYVGWGTYVAGPGRRSPCPAAQSPLRANPPYHPKPVSLDDWSAPAVPLTLRRS